MDKELIKELENYEKGKKREALKYLFSKYGWCRYNETFMLNFLEMSRFIWIWFGFSETARFARTKK